MGGEPGRVHSSVAGRVSDAGTIDECIAIILAELDVSHVTYHMSYKDEEGFEQPFLRTSYSPEWIGRYLLMNYIAIDPVAKAGYKVSEPVSWGDLDWSSSAASAFRNDALNFGIGENGLLVPVIDARRRRATVNYCTNFNSAQWASFLNKNADTLRECADILHSKAVQEIFSDKEMGPVLSPRELQCLVLAAKGYDAGRMASKLNLSEHTVRDYCKAAREKLGCNNLAQAVHKATIMRLIDTRFSD